MPQFVTAKEFVEMVARVRKYGYDSTFIVISDELKALEEELVAKRREYDAVLEVGLTPEVEWDNTTE